MSRNLIVAIAFSVSMGSIAFANHTQTVAEQANKILAASGIQGGLVLHIGSGDGRLTAALAHDRSFLVHGLDADTDNVKLARNNLQSLGIYGRVSIQTLRGSRLPLTDNLVNLVVAEDLGTVEMDEVIRVLCPNGVAMIRRNGQWEKTVKPRPANIDEWTHWLHAADGNAVAQDTTVGPPRHLQWIAKPLWLRHHNMTINLSAMVSAKGRLFYLLDDSPSGVVGPPDQWALYARDAFNGTLLWKRTITDWGWSSWTKETKAKSTSRFDHPLDWPRRLVANNEHLFIAMGEHSEVSMLDARTGETIRNYPGTQRASELLFHEGKLIISVHRPPNQNDSDAVLRKTIMVFNAASGKLLWKRSGLSGVISKTGPLQRFTHLYLTAAGNRLFHVNQDSIVGINLENGQELWRMARPPRKDLFANYTSIFMANLCTLVARDDMLLFAQSAAYPKNQWYTPTRITLIAIASDDGRELWRTECGSWNCYAPPDLFVIDDLAWVHSRTTPYEMTGLDVATGIVRERFETGKAMVAEHHHRCYRNKATTNFVLTGRRGVELLGLKTHEIERNHWIRGTCRYGILPCNGLLYVPPDPCICYITAKVNGLVAIAPERIERQSTHDSEPLERGPAFPQISNKETKSGSGTINDDWPTFRHDARRTSGMAAEISAALQLAWTEQHGDQLTPATIANRRVFVAETNRHRILALDVATGKQLWEFTCGGPIDSPPTIHQGIVLFGSADGHVYALRESDGELYWRRRVAQTDLRVMAFGQLESPWPVHGSILVQDGVAFAAAGRSSFLDGGIRVVALDPATGRLLQDRQIYSPDPQTGEVNYGTKLRYDMPADNPGALADILVSDGTHLYMRHVRLNPQDIRRDFAKEITLAEVDDLHKHQIPKVYSPGPQVACSAGLLDDSRFNQTYWSYQRASHSQLLAVGAGVTFGIRDYPGRPNRHSRTRFVAGKDAYLLFADRQEEKHRRLWSRPVPIRVAAMAAVGAKLVVAGTVDEDSLDDPWASYEGRGAGKLAIFSATDGKPLAEYPLDSPPVWNGIAVANGRIVLSLRNGTVVCFKKDER